MFILYSINYWYKQFLIIHIKTIITNYMHYLNLILDMDCIDCSTSANSTEVEDPVLLTVDDMKSETLISSNLWYVFSHFSLSFMSI